MGRGLEMGKDLTINVLQTGPASHTCRQFLPLPLTFGFWRGRGQGSHHPAASSPSSLLPSQPPLNRFLSTEVHLDADTSRRPQPALQDWNGTNRGVSGQRLWSTEMLECGGLF